MRWHHLHVHHLVAVSVVFSVFLLEKVERRGRELAGGKEWK